MLVPNQSHGIPEETLQVARQRQTTESFKLLYQQRKGVEGTMSQSIRGMDVRHARYRGLGRTHLQHVATAAAINLTRICLLYTSPSPRD